MGSTKLWFGIKVLGSARLCTVAALILLIADRVLSVPGFAEPDNLLGRVGGSALFLVALLLLIAAIWQPVTASPERDSTTPRAAPAGLQDLLDTHLELDHAIDEKLIEVVDDTERSALAIIAQVRTLYDSAHQLVQYLENSSPHASSLGNDIVDSVSYLVEIGAFIQELPDKMTRDLQSVQSVVQEITELSSLVGSVHAISMQSHLLAINAAIQGSQAGPAGAAFRVVADEMRLLASNTSAVASKISEGLRRARSVVEGGMSIRIAESSKALNDVSHAVTSIEKLQENFEDMNQYFKTRFAVITQHNRKLSFDIAEVLGHIQYQDVVRQCIERLRGAIRQRNALLQSSVDPLQQDAVGALQLQESLGRILQEFVAQEEIHKHSARHDAQSGGEPKFELF